MKFGAGLIAGIALVGMALVGASVSSRVSRSNLAGLERLADSKVVAIDANNPGEALGPTRGVYLEKFGAVFTTEVDLIPFAAPNPFRPAYKDSEISKLRTQKQNRIDILKQRMVETMVLMAKSLEGVPADENIALAVTIPYWPWEKSAGMPQQILIQAPKSALLTGGNGLSSALKVQEF